MSEGTRPPAAPADVACPACGAAGGGSFYAVSGVPVHDVRLYRSREEALACLRGDIRLFLCPRCSFIWNGAFDPALLDYWQDYESTQACSATFNRFHERLARDLIARYRLEAKTVIEIGCGQGEFLTLLCEIGGGRGVGFDPAYTGEAQRGDVAFVKDLYSEAYADREADFVCCKMTLEHIADPAAFMVTMGRAVGGRQGVVVFFQVPDVARVLAERAFWDIYYEHCSYYGRHSLTRLFRAAGFEVLKTWRDYDDQYLMIEARPGAPGDGQPALEPTPPSFAREVAGFARQVTADLGRWRERLSGLAASGRRVVLWGSGSKAVAFLTTLGVEGAVDHVVDINPLRQGTYLAGGGQEIVAPEALPGLAPDLVIVMNPIYRAEIGNALADLGLRPELETL